MKSKNINLMIATFLLFIGLSAKAQEAITVANVDKTSTTTETVTIPYNSTTGKYEVSTVMHLRAISQAVRNGEKFAGKSFVLKNDITFTESDMIYSKDGSATTKAVASMVGESNFLPIGGWTSEVMSEGEKDMTHFFSGTFDGQGHKVVGLQIKYSPKVISNVSQCYYVGLFGLVSGATIKNLAVEDAKICGHERTAPLIGRTINNSLVSNCHASKCEVTSDGKAGGLIGGSTNSTIENSFVTGGTLISGAEQSKYAELGGLIGSIRGGYVTNCYVTSTTVKGNVAGMTTAGLIGQANDNARIKSSFVATKVINEVEGITTGGVIAADANKVKLPNTFYNSDSISSTSSGAGGTPKTTAEMQSDEFLTLLGPGFVKDVNNINGGFLITVQQAIENGINPISLIVGHWNLIGDFGNTFDALNHNTGGKNGGTTYTNDIAAIKYDYTKNNWSEEYLLKTDATKQGHSYFIWPFPNAIAEEGQDTGKPLDNNNKIIYLKDAFTPATNDVVFNETVSGDNQNGYWFALSNPFKLPLQAQKKDIPTEIQGQTVYIYDAKTNQWENNVDVVVNSISPSQGFMVAKAEAGTLNVKLSYEQGKILPNTTKKTAVTNKAKENTQSALISFVAKANNTEKEVYARQNDNSSNGFDIKDAYSLFSINNIDLVEPYFTVEGRNLLSNEFETLPYECPINFRASKESDVQFSLMRNIENIVVSIIDLQNDNKETILSDSTIFNFVADSGSNEGRYKIKFVKKDGASLCENLQIPQVSIWNNNREINITGENLKSVQIFNALGQNVYSQELNNNNYKLTLDNKAGIYVVKVRTNSGNKSEKIIIK